MKSRNNILFSAIVLLCDLLFCSVRCNLRNVGKNPEKKDCPFPHSFAKIITSIQHIFFFFYLSLCGEGYGVVRATGHLFHLLADEVGGNQGRSKAVVSGAITKLTVAIVTPGIYFSIYRHRRHNTDLRMTNICSSFCLGDKHTGKSRFRI